MFHYFGWKLPIQGQILGVLGKQGSNFNFSFYNPKKAHPCAILLGHGLMGVLMHPPPTTYILWYFHLPLGLWT